MTFIFEAIRPETLILFGFIILLALQVSQQNRKMQAYEKRLKILKGDLQALLLCSRGVGDKLNYQFNEFRNLIERQDRLELNEKGEPSYKQAMALLDRGVSEDEMIDTCDLTQGEAELIAQLRKTRSVTNHVELVA